MKKKDVEYNVFSFRLNDLTYEKLKSLRRKYGKSWNLIFYKLVEYEKENEKLKKEILKLNNLIK